MKTWEAPKLIVLVKSKPDEAVLQTCKWPVGTSLPGPETVNTSCVVACTSACYNWGAS